MGEGSKSPVIILVLLIVFSLLFAGGIFYFLQQEQQKNTALQVELTDLKARQKAAETRLEESKELIGKLETKLKDAQDQITALSADLSREKASKEDAFGRIEKLKNDLDQQKGLRADLEKKLGLAQEEMKRAQDQVKGLESKKTELEAKVVDLEAKQQQMMEAQQQQQQRSQDVELGKIIVSPEDGGEQAMPDAGKKVVALESEGKVLVFNREYNFVVINLGSKDGVRVGDVFTVYRKNKPIGDIKVEKIHDSMSAAGFLSRDMKDKVSEGDKVVRRAR